MLHQRSEHSTFTRGARPLHALFAVAAIAVGIGACAPAEPVPDDEAQLASFDSLLADLGGPQTENLSRAQRWRLVASVGTGLPPASYRLEDLPEQGSRAVGLQQAYCLQCHGAVESEDAQLGRVADPGAPHAHARGSSGQPSRGTADRRHGGRHADGGPPNRGTSGCGGRGLAGGVLPEKRLSGRDRIRDPGHARRGPVRRPLLGVPRHAVAGLAPGRARSRRWWLE